MSNNVFNQAVAGAALNAIIAQLGADVDVLVYDDTPPANSGAALSSNNQLVSGQITSFSNASYSSGVSGMVSNVTFSSTSYPPSSGGVASFARFVTSGGTCVRQVTCGASGSGAELILGNTIIQTGVNVQMSYSLQLPSDEV